MLAPGTVVHGRYEVVRQVGRGGMGAVYEATDSRLRCRVALKEMRVGGPEAAAAFEHEAQLLASLRHSVLPAVIDHFVDDAGQFLVMQFIDGEDLDTGLTKRGVAFGLTDVLPWLESLLGALEYLHAQQPPIIHRDIKPANLKLTPDGQIVLLDFGLAKGIVGGGEAEPAPSVHGYTPRYSPIEQVDGTGTDARSDIYALGATFYHLLTGAAPPNALARATALVNRAPDPLLDAHSVRPEVPPAVGAVLAKALALARGQRYASVAAMRADFREAISRPEAAGAFARPEARSRRIDAAVPSQAQVGARIDLIVQVRFPDSPRLGLEDWPSRRLPDAIEQTSEVVRLTFPVDRETGCAGPARLRVRLVAPDFLIEGDAQRTIEVPPDAYSQRLSFLLTAARPGLCRINVEVYAADSVFLGTVPVETDVSGAPVEVAKLCVSNLVLSVIAREVAGLMARAADKSPSAAATVPRSAEVGLADHFAPLSVGPTLAADEAPRADPAQSADQTGSWKAIAERPPMAVAPRCDVGTTPAPARRRRVARALAPAAALVLLVTAGTVYLLRPGRQAPVSEASPQASVVAQTPAAPMAQQGPPPETKKPAPALALQVVPETRTEVTMTGEYPFEVLDVSGRVISPAAQSHEFTVAGRPRLRIRNQDYFVDEAVHTDGEATFKWVAPGLGRLQVRGREACTLSIAGRHLGESPLTRIMGAGKYVAEITCEGRTTGQAFSIRAGETSDVVITK
jgi:hypothetical protein